MNPEKNDTRAEGEEPHKVSDLLFTQKQLFFQVGAHFLNSLTANGI